MRLIVFDVDGTLARTTRVDALCYIRTVAEQLAVEVDTNWSAYRHVTDAGILSEILKRNRIAETPARVAAVHERFLNLLSAALQADPGFCREVPGASALLQHLRELPGVCIAIATGSWAESARLKLAHASIGIEHLPLASSDDSPSREEILRLACKRAAVLSGTPFDSMTYLGDAPWDVSAARALGCGFIGIACDGDAGQLRAAGSSLILRDFTDRDAVLKQLLGEPRS
jgi:phosphoglycolate phosphatase-like HAD superfamily hydrolase